MSDKFSKQMGVMPLAAKRKIDPVPLKATPKMAKRVKVHKRFGYESRTRYRHYVTGEWKDWGKWYRYHWYVTAARRDQAMNSYHGYWTDPGKREAEVRPVER